MGAWIEINLLDDWAEMYVMSHPTMGAWIEIEIKYEGYKELLGRTPRWVRGLK